MIVMKIVRTLGRQLAGFFSSKKRAASASQLMGIYMSDTNGRDGYSAELQANRQRRNGKYSHTRERA
jgi:hypothetical protein